MVLLSSVAVLTPLFLAYGEMALRPWAGLIGLGPVIGFALLAFGGVMRPLIKTQYHEKLEPYEPMRAAANRSLILRLFWWLDAEGGNRDA